jgi:hypothetical protein
LEEVLAELWAGALARALVAWLELQ